MSAIERITVSELHARFKAQGVSAREHIALKCVMCGTIQSMALLAKAGLPEKACEQHVGFNCVGRFTGAKGWTKSTKPGDGCDWTLGGLLRMHNLEVVTDDGEARPIFDVATPEEAQALERQMKAQQR